MPIAGLWCLYAKPTGMVKGGNRVGLVVGALSAAVKVWRAAAAACKNWERKQKRNLLPRPFWLEPTMRTEKSCGIHESPSLVEAKWGAQFSSMWNFAQPIWQFSCDAAAIYVVAWFSRGKLLSTNLGIYCFQMLEIHLDWVFIKTHLIHSICTWYVL